MLNRFDRYRHIISAYASYLMTDVNHQIDTLKRSDKVKYVKKQADRITNMDNYKLNRCKREDKYRHHAGRKLARRVGKMTNWQNHQWMKGGMKDDRIDHFLALPRRR